MRTNIWAACLSLLVAGCATERSVKILSYNVRHCADVRNVLSPQATAATIAREKPCFAALQEMDVRVKRTNGVDQPAALARLTGMHSFFAEGIPLQGGSYGNALLSKTAGLRRQVFPLPGKEPRVLLLVEFDDCFIGSMHLALAAQDQLDSLPIIQQAVSDAAARKPVFLCGDWNATPDSPTLKAIATFMTVISTQQTNTFHGMAKAGVSTADRVKRGSVIDFIAVDKAHAGQIKVLESHVVEDRETSDHAPIAVTVSL